MVAINLAKTYTHSLDLALKFSNCVRYSNMKINKVISIEYIVFTKPRFVMSGTLIFSHNSQNMTYFVTKFGMRTFCMVP